MASLMFILNRPGAITMPIDPRVTSRLYRATLPENNKAALECHGNFVLTETPGRDNFAIP
jgi:hypothetical protein